jgi:DNA processing protein
LTYYSSINITICQAFFGEIVDKQLTKHKLWLTLGNNPRFTASLFNEIYALNQPIKSIFYASEQELKRFELSSKCITEIINARDVYIPEDIIRELDNKSIQPLFVFEDTYPARLREIADPPFLLYMRGNVNWDQMMIGVVGSRNMTDYGTETTEKIAADLASCGVIVVSGLALGIDTVAHQSTINEGGNTVAVLGNGIDRVYPGSNLGLAKEILCHGAIISEYPPGISPAKQNFPSRNRIISGLCQGLVVTEAAEGSGSLITARSALEQNREVFAVPGSIFNLNSVGPNNLIKMGAHPITSVQDIFDEFGISHPEVATGFRDITGSTETENIIIDILRLEPKHVDEIIRVSGLPHSIICSTITIMEVGGKVKHLGNMTFRLNN